MAAEELQTLQLYMPLCGSTAQHTVPQTAAWEQSYYPNYTVQKNSFTHH